MERYWIENGILAPNECGGLVKYADAQRALDVEREKVKGLEALRVGFDGQDEVIEMEKSAYYALRDKLATLQARTDHDAALRRAKAEGVASVRRIIQTCLIDLRLSRSTSRLSFAMDEYDAQIEALESIMRQTEEPFSRHNENGIDVRAAQIEAGDE